MKEKETLQEAYKIAKTLDFNTISNTVKKDINVLINKIDSNKSLVSALVTSLVKKIHEPNQDIRLHRTDFQNGYSARSLDTNVTSPFFKEKFPKYANKESSFLTLATREKVKWTKIEGEELKIRDKQLKNSFLNIFDDVETNNADPKEYLYYLFAKLILLSEQEQELFTTTSEQVANFSSLNINIILEMLQKHFDIKQSSRLPVIAIYSIYEILLPKFERYKDKKLIDLQVHTSSDKRGYGDIEIYNQDNTPFEIVEIKHNIPIDKFLIFDISKKTAKIKVDRYYILTTYQKSFASNEAEKEVMDYIIDLKAKQGIDVIANGIITTLKYYLRFIDDYEEFIKVYTKNLIIDAKKSTEVKNVHLESWNEIMNNYKITE